MFARATLRAINRRTFSIGIAVLLVFAGAARFGHAHASRESARPAAAPAPLTNKFRLHKFEQPIGEETYEEAVSSSLGPGHITCTIEFKFTDRGTPVPLKANFTGDEDLNPQEFAISGRNARTAAIDEEVEVKGDKIRSRIDKNWTETARPEKFFTIAGYAPATMQMLLV